MMLSLNGALSLHNSILDYVRHQLSKAQFTMLLTYCVPALVLHCSLFAGRPRSRL